MSFSLDYHPDVRKDLKRIGKAEQRRISGAILHKLLEDPYRFGKPLQQSLKGGRSLRIGDCRVLYSIRGNEVRVCSVFHRREDYEGLEGRLTWALR